MGYLKALQPSTMIKLLYTLILILDLNSNLFKPKINQLYVYSYGFHPRIEKRLNISDIINNKLSIFLIIKDKTFLHQYDSLRKSIVLDTVLINRLADPRLVCIRQKGKVKDTVVFSQVGMQLNCNIITKVDTSLLMLIYPRLPSDHQFGIDEFIPFYRNPNLK